MRDHQTNPQVHWLCALAALGSHVLACDGLVGADVECDKICITSVGPTVPGLGVPVDGGVPDGLAAQPATMEFNVPLSQLSKAVAEVDVEAYLSSLRLMAPADLAFVESAQIILRAGSTDGGVRPADAATTPVNPAAPDAATAITTPPPGPIDGGPLPILEDDLPNIRADQCLSGGQGFTVGTYRKPVTTAVSVGRTIDLVPATKEANLWQCLRGAPSKFTVAMSILPLYLPATDTPVSLKVCISAKAGATFP
jgi:hypothetical protein